MTDRAVRGDRSCNRSTQGGRVGGSLVQGQPGLQSSPKELKDSQGCPCLSQKKKKKKSGNTQKGCNTQATKLFSSFSCTWYYLVPGVLLSVTMVSYNSVCCSVHLSVSWLQFLPHSGAHLPSGPESKTLRLTLLYFCLKLCRVAVLIIAKLKL